MQVTTGREGTEGIIRLNGRFDLHSHAEFRKASLGMAADQTLSALVVDFTEVDYIDSSALGQLLVVQQVMDERGKKVVLAHCGPSLRRAIEIANFHKIFEIR